MRGIDFENLTSEIATLRTTFPVGRISEIGRGTIKLTGLSGVSAIGDLVSFERLDDDDLIGEILHIDQKEAIVLLNGQPEGQKIGDPVKWLGNNEIFPDDSWLGRVIDPFGKAMDGGPVMRGSVAKPLLGERLAAVNRRGLGDRMETGLTVFNTILPIVRGQRIGIFAGSGVGKSTLIAKLATRLQTEIVVIALIGERSREVREFVERVLGPQGMKRAVVVAATSDQSSLLRRRCAWAAMAVAEHFRDSGHQVLFVADSITRFAEAHREVALSTGEPGSFRGFPPSVTHTITSLCERAGPGTNTGGDITAVFSVLVAGSDMEEPIADIMRGVLDGHIVLDREIAERGRFPAIDVLRSASRSLPLAATDSENALIMDARKLLGCYDRNEMMIRAGLYTAGSDPEIDHAIQAWPDLDDFLAADENGNTSDSFLRLEKCISSDIEDKPDTAD